MKYLVIVNVNGEKKTIEHWLYAQALSHALKLRNLGYDTRVEEIKR